MDEAGGDVGGGEARAFPHHVRQQPGGRVVAAVLAVIMAQAVIGQSADILRFVQKSEALEGADADVAVLQADEGLRASEGSSFVRAPRRPNQRKGLRGLGAERLEHRSQHFAPRPSASAGTSPKRL